MKKMINKGNVDTQENMIHFRNSFVPTLRMNQSNLNMQSWILISLSQLFWILQKYINFYRDKIRIVMNSWKLLYLEFLEASLIK